jgi:uncharacterized repeat protein (TIGR01451 family)
MKRTVIGIMFMFLLAPMTAAAQQKGGMDIKSVSEVERTITDGQGKKVTTRVAASQANVVPGDTVIFTNYYSYAGAKEATDVIIKNPIPEHMIYVVGSAEGKGAKIDYSIDKGKTFAGADKLMVTDAQGRTRRAVAADYTHIRWIVGKVAPGGKGSVSFKAKVK